MTPHTISVLFHHYCIDGKWPLGETPAYQSSIQWLYGADLIDRQDAMARVTPRGRALVKMLCATPLPKQAFINPQTGEVVPPDA